MYPFLSVFNFSGRKNKTKHPTKTLFVFLQLRYAPFPLNPSGPQQLGRGSAAAAAQAECCSVLSPAEPGLLLGGAGSLSAPAGARLLLIHNTEVQDRGKGLRKGELRRATSAATTTLCINKCRYSLLLLLLLFFIILLNLI